MQDNPNKAGKLEQGIVFPENAQGRRSSTAAVKKIFADSVGDIHPGLAQDILNAKKWRKKYPGLINRINRAAIKSCDHPVNMAQKGLDSAYQTLQFIRGEARMTIDEAMTRFCSPKFHTAIINGSRPPRRGESFALPYKNRVLSKDSLTAQLQQWEEQDIFEPSFGLSLRKVVENEKWTDLSGRTFVLLGAGSEIAPFKTLLDLGATVVAVDLPRPAIWERLIRIAKNSCGRLILPMNRAFDPALNDGQLAAVAGADLACDTPEILTWLQDLPTPYTIGGYAYADGALHVRIAMAMDAVINHITRRHKDVSIAFYLTPSDSYAVPVETARASASRREKGPHSSFFYSAARFLSLGTMFAPHNPDRIESDNTTTYSLSDNIILQQGPGYILAKNIQKWRCLTARARGIRVSGNVAPATTTRSVFKNRLLAAGYAGLAHFRAEAFKSETTSALMTAALICDLNDDTSAANPETILSHPLELFMKNANHGGLWRIAFKPASVLVFSVCLGALKALKRKLRPKERSSDRDPGRAQQLIVKNE